MANKLVKFLGETYGKSTLVGNIKAGGWKAFFDGNVMEQILHGTGGTLIGTDQLGNKYYERKGGDYGRHRWVVYGNMDFMTGQDATTIPSEWHSWINHITDVIPTKENTSVPIYAVSPLKHTGDYRTQYLPKGAWKNPEKRNWTKIQCWVPPGQ